MDLEAYREEIKLRLTGGVLELEIDDQTLDKIINSSLREVQRYISTVNIVTVPFSRCISLKDYKINSVTNVYRSEGFATSNTTSGISDPMMVAQWQLLSGTGNLYNYQSYALDYAAWNTILQIRNTSSTDMAFWYNQFEKNLYINISTNAPAYVTVEYVPRYDTVEEVVSDYWIDVLMKMSIALTKVTLGRIRSRYTQSNALWTQDGQQMLDEGNAELEALRNHLLENTQLMYPID